MADAQSKPVQKSGRATGGKRALERDKAARDALARELQESERALKAKMQLLRDMKIAIAAKERQEARKVENRRKYLAGAAVLTWIKGDSIVYEAFGDFLRSFLSQDRDKQVFPEFFEGRSVVLEGQPKVAEEQTIGLDKVDPGNQDWADDVDLMNSIEDQFKTLVDR